MGKHAYNPQGQSTIRDGVRYVYHPEHTSPAPGEKNKYYLMYLTAEEIRLITKARKYDERLSGKPRTLPPRNF